LILSWKRDSYSYFPVLDYCGGKTTVCISDSEMKSGTQGLTFTQLSFSVTQCIQVQKMSNSNNHPIIYPQSPPDSDCRAQSLAASNSRSPRAITSCCNINTSLQ
jgi:hypothetical protein